MLKPQWLDAGSRSDKLFDTRSNAVEEDYPDIPIPYPWEPDDDDSCPGNTETHYGYIFYLLECGIL